MKLLYCIECQDIIRLIETERVCMCGKTKGRYINHVEAIYSGSGIPIGLNNTKFVEAMFFQPENGPGRVFEAFVIPKECETFKEVKE